MGTPKHITDLVDELHDLIAHGLGTLNRDKEALKALDQLRRAINRELTPKRMTNKRLDQEILRDRRLYGRLLGITQATGNPEDAFLYLRHRCQEIGLGLPSNKYARSLCVKIAKSLEPAKPKVVFEDEASNDTDLFE